MARWFGDRAHICNIFIRVLGAIFLVAFLSLLVQLQELYGSRGLLPACTYLEEVRNVVRLLEAPTLFWFHCSDGALRAAAIVGAVLSLALLFNVAPRYALIALWLLYLSFVTIGQDFMSFQWDNLLLEAAFFSLFIVPGGVYPRNPPGPHPIGTFLMLWLVFRLHVESGAAKLLSGDPTWRDLTAMVAYYETAPLPTWIGWYAHQMPMWAHKGTALFTFLVEIGLAPLVFGPHRIRGVVFVMMLGMQLMIALTANYGFFNYLSAALCLWVLDDGHLRWLASRCGRVLRAAPAAAGGPLKTLLYGGAAVALVPLSTVPFLRFTPWHDAVPHWNRFLNVYRSVNAYHLFASMTRVRPEAIIEGSNDGEHWEEYQFCYKAGDPLQAPPFVAPHQPRVDFQMWFLLLGGHPGAPYFDTLLRRLLTEPQSVAGLFCQNPFGERAPRYVRIAVYQYRFTDRESGARTGRWWERQLMGYSQPITRDVLQH